MVIPMGIHLNPLGQQERYHLLSTFVCSPHKSSPATHVTVLWVCTMVQEFFTDFSVTLFGSTQQCCPVILDIKQSPIEVTYMNRLRLVNRGVVMTYD